ncbi:hypothetical protein [Paractinoplanes lichenicola]|uniref:Ig-like domain repeat protein n=1 Tax=Paractinoplanes lichenicola TaxID=2802976 RepID=A0ABS1W5Y7_9ACTN|nr:hypothetical protein [Actinoplanes lichenicola]MBL7262107.1 hypothetical protein [Actinoplanes lichenicola]
MHKLRVAVLAAVVAGAATTVVALGTGTSSAADIALARGNQLLIKSATDVLVDPMHKQVLISDATGGQLVATNYDGAVLATRTGLPGINGLALSPDGRTLYAAVTGSRAIAIFDAATLTKQRSTPLVEPYTPTTMTTVADGVRFGYEIPSKAGRPSSVEVLDTGTIPLHAGHITADTSPLHGAPLFLTAPGDPDRRLAVDTSADARTGGSVWIETNASWQSGAIAPLDAPVRGAALSADGATLIGWGDGCTPWKVTLATNERSPAYAGRCNPASIDVHPDGRVAIGYNNSGAGTDIAVFPRGAETSTQTFAAPTGEIIDDVAWQPDGPRLFAITRNAKSEFRMWVMNSPAAAPRVKPTLTMSGNGATVPYNSTVTLTARIGAPGRVVEIWADPWGGDQPLRLVKRATSNSAGIVSTTFKLTRTTSVTAKFVGDSNYLPTEAKSTIHTRTTVALATSRQYTTKKVGTIPYAYFRKSVKPYFTTTMPAYPGRRQTLQMEFWNGNTWRPLRSAHVAVNSAGKSHYTLTGMTSVNVPLRARATYRPYDPSTPLAPNDAVNALTYGNWLYFRFTA